MYSGITHKRYPKVDNNSSQNIHCSTSCKFCLHCIDKSKDVYVKLLQMANLIYMVDII